MFRTTCFRMVVLSDSVGIQTHRTMPLWRVSDRPHFLHDGSAKTLTEAIQAHGGQDAAAASAFELLTDADKAALLAFGLYLTKEGQ